MRLLEYTVLRDLSTPYDRKFSAYTPSYLTAPLSSVTVISVLYSKSPGGGPSLPEIADHEHPSPVLLTTCGRSDAPRSTLVATLYSLPTLGAVSPCKRITAGYRDSYQRLGDVKKKYHLTNLFRMNQNISPNGARAG